MHVLRFAKWRFANDFAEIRMHVLDCWIRNRLLNSQRDWKRIESIVEFATLRKPFKVQIHVLHFVNDDLQMTLRKFEFACYAPDNVDLCMALHIHTLRYSKKILAHDVESSEGEYWIHSITTHVSSIVQLSQDLFNVAEKLKLDRSLMKPKSWKFIARWWIEQFTQIRFIAHGMKSADLSFGNRTLRKRKAIASTGNLICEFSLRETQRVNLQSNLQIVIRRSVARELEISRIHMQTSSFFEA